MKNTALCGILHRTLLENIIEGYMQQFEKYEKFNSEAYERFFMPHLDSYANVASLLANVSEIQDSKFLGGACAFIKDNDWSLLCTTNSNGVPLYLGIIVVQLLAAAERTDDELCTSKAYNPRLRKLVNIDTENNLQQKYRSAQEKIYDLFEQWCKSRLFSIYLSRRSSRRFVQLPLSLALLHKRDLESLSSFFHHCDLYPGDEIDFYSFNQIIQSNTGALPPSIYRKWHQISDSDRKQALCKQIYSAFLSWDGSYEANAKHYVRKQRQAKEYTMYWLGHEMTSPQLFCDEEEISYYNFIRNFPKGCFFEQDSLRRNDWARISEYKLYAKKDFQYAWVVGNTPFVNNVKRYVGEPNYNYGDGQFKIFMISSQKLKLLVKYFPDHFINNSQEPFVKLIGGLKIGPRKWLAGAGPVIQSEGNVGMTAHLINCRNNEKTTINIADSNTLIDLPSGRYLFKYSPEAPAILFTISSDWQDATCQGGGWNINDEGIYPIAENEFQLQGLDFSKFPVFENADFIPTGNTLQQWMCLAVGKNNVEISNENIVHKALRRKLNGIRNR